jgi:ligand-binding sensor domain-containing protein/signal transduction histidine kinase
LVYFAAMSFLRRWLVSVLLLTGGVVQLSAQSGLDWMTSHVWRMQDGLPDQIVQAIAQTPDHYLWIGTKLGLVRFDGFHFLEYGGDAAPALRDFGVDCILVARDSSLWVGTQGGGVVHLSRNGSHTYGIDAGLESGLVRALYEDDSGRIWAGADHGLYRLDNESGGRFLRIDDIVRTPNLAIHAIVGDGHGGIWAGGSRLLHFPAKPSGTPWEEQQLPRQAASIRIWALAFAPDETLWVGTLSGLLRVHDGVISKERPVSGGILSLQIDARQRLWIGTSGGGLFQIDRGGAISHPAAAMQITSDTVLALAEDKGRNLWVGTQSGLVRFSATGMHLTRIPSAINADFGSVSVDTDRSLWVCSRQLIHISHGDTKRANLPSVQHVPVRSVMREQSGAFWVGTLGRGAYRIAPNGHIDHYTTEIGTNYIRAFIETAHDGVWIASDGGVANWHDGHLTSYQDSSGAPRAQTIAMAPGARGELWVGTYHGLFFLKNGAYVPSAASLALGAHMVLALHSSRDGTLWIGTENGLFLWRNQHLRRITFDNEMGGKAILSILEDGRGRVWLGGSRTVLRANLAVLEAIAENPSLRGSFAPEIFAISGETGAELSGSGTSNAVLDGADGAWFASYEGPLHIQAEEVALSDEPPPLTLGRVAVDGRRIATRDRAVLEPSAKTLEIDATPIELSARSGLQLRRRLIGFDTRWTRITSMQPATYTNLPPGEYIYRVEANWTGSSRISSLEFPIVQRSHFYRRPLFLGACGATLILFAWLVHLLHVRQVTLRFRLISEERGRVAREIHDTVVQGCIGVSSLLEAVAIRQPRVPDMAEEHHLLDSAREQIAITIAEARDAIWDLRHPQDGGGLAHSLRAMLDRMTAIQNTIVEFECEGAATPLKRESEHELLMTVREALQNAIAHAAPAHILLRLQYDAEKITIIVHDDGRGFESGTLAGDQSMHFGLVGMCERMERVAGSCTIDSGVGVGAKVTLELPVHPNLRTLKDI